VNLRLAIEGDAAMNITAPKKMNILLILEVLKKHTDDENKLNQATILDLVEQEYGISVDRHALKRNLDNLLDLNCGVVFDPRNPVTGEPGGWYFMREITDAEMRMLIDGLISSKYIAYDDCMNLIKKLEDLSSTHFRRSSALPQNRIENREIFFNIEEIIYARRQKCKIAFNYMRYGTDLKMHVGTDEDGLPRRHVVSPYNIVITNERYYLICSKDDSDELTHYRLDNICNIEVLEDEKCRPIKELPGFSAGFNLSDYMKPRIYMYSGKVSRVTFRANKLANRNIVSHIIDWFGKDVRFSDECEEFVLASATVNEHAMLFWALQYGTAIEVLEPTGLRKEIRKTISKIADVYNTNQ